MHCVWPEKAQGQEGKWHEISKSPRGHAGERNPLLTWLHPVPLQSSVSHENTLHGSWGGRFSGSSREVHLPFKPAQSGCLSWATEGQTSDPTKVGFQDTACHLPGRVVRPDGKRERGLPSHLLPPQGSGVLSSSVGQEHSCACLLQMSHLARHQPQALCRMHPA